VEVGRFLSGEPGLLARGAVLEEQLDAITRNGPVLAPETVADIGRAEARRNRWMTAALWVIAVVLVWLAYLLLSRCCGAHCVDCNAIAGYIRHGTRSPWPASRSASSTMI